MSTDITPNSGPVEPTRPDAETAAPTGVPADAPIAVEPPAEDGTPARTPKPDRKRLWQVGAALLLTVATGAAAAVAVTLPDRTDLPGLATPNDGRYAFPELTLPPLPVGASAPADYRVKTHAADLRGLLLPLPKGAVGTGPSAAPSASPNASGSASPSPSPSADPGASGTASPSAPATLPPVAGRWMPCDRDMMLAKEDKYAKWLISDACRAAAGQGWTAKDGTTTELRLIRFGSQDEASHFFSNTDIMGETKDIESSRLDQDGKYPVAFGQVVVRLSEARSGGLPTGRLGWLQCGDIVALVQLTNPHGVNDQAFHQVLLLQSALLAGGMSNADTKVS
ncbi:hypothetical protein [Kitasatospora sp. NPDC004531]